MRVEMINSKQASRILADMSSKIKPNEANIIRTVGDNMVTDSIRDVVYECKNEKGTYYWHKVYKDNVLVIDNISVSLGEICKQMNRWMRRNKI